MFITFGIVLSTQEIRDRERLYTVFTERYGKISLFRKESPTAAFVDIGTLCEWGIDRKWETNKARSVRIVSHVGKEWKNYESLSQILWILGILSRFLPEGAPSADLYEDAKCFVQATKDNDPLFVSRSVELFGLRIAHFTLGHNTVETEHKDLRKIIALASGNSLAALLRITGITPDLLRSLHFHNTQVFQNIPLW